MDTSITNLGIMNRRYVKNICERKFRARDERRLAQVLEVGILKPIQRKTEPTKDSWIHVPGE